MIWRKSTVYETSSGQPLAKRKVFSLLRNCVSSSPGHRSSAGIVFHADGHDTAKARGPIVEVLHRGTTRSPDELERRSCCLCNELTGLQRPMRYPGAVPFKQRKAITHSLKVVRAGNWSQWRSVRIASAISDVRGRTRTSRAAARSTPLSCLFRKVGAPPSKPLQ